MGIESQAQACVTGSAAGAADLLRLQATVLWQRGFAQAAAAFATELCDRLHCKRVALGWIERDGNSVVALSHSADFDPRQALLEKIAAAMDEALEQAGTIVLPARAGAAPQVTLAHVELAGSGAPAMCTVLL